VAKAAFETIAKLSLKDALACAVEVTQYRLRAERFIIELIARKLLRWGWEKTDGFCRPDKTPHDMVRELWRSRNTRFNWEQSSASLPITPDGAAFTISGIVVAAEELDLLISKYLRGPLRVDQHQLAKAPAKPRGEVEEWVFNRMNKDGPKKIFDHSYVDNLYEQQLDTFGVSKGRIRNLVGHYRNTEFLAIKPAPRTKSAP
jgi:hypothetical protein